MDNQKQSEELLRKEGFKDVYTATDEPNAYYKAHQHSDLNAHIILSGQIEFVISDKTTLCKPGDRFDVTANTMHTAKNRT